MNVRMIHLLIFLLLFLQDIVAQKKISPILLDSISKELVFIYDSDQDIRLRTDSIAKLANYDEHLLQGMIDSMVLIDSINVGKICRLIDTYGWLGADQIGEKANTAIFLVIQHARLAIQTLYLPAMRKAVDEKKAKPSHLALLEDRIRLRKGDKQIYGSQIGLIQETGERFVLPLEDPDNVDKRRASVGLGPLSDYVKYWGLEWNPQEYKKRNYPNTLKGRE